MSMYFDLGDETLALSEGFVAIAVALARRAGISVAVPTPWTDDARDAHRRDIQVPESPGGIDRHLRRPGTAFPRGGPLDAPLTLLPARPSRNPTRVRRRTVTPADGHPPEYGGRQSHRSALGWLAAHNPPARRRTWAPSAPGSRGAAVEVAQGAGDVEVDAVGRHGLDERGDAHQEPRICS